jgi:branched-chain amino acid transport system substrate-binding protein
MHAKSDVLGVGALGLDGNQLIEAMKKLDYMPPRHFHLFPAPGPLALSPDGKQALSVSVFEEHPPFMANPRTARLVSLFHEKATKANVPYPNVDTQVAGSFPPGRSSMQRSRRRRASTTRCSDSGCARTRSTR